MPDEELVRSQLRGELGAAEEICRRYGRDAERMVIRICGFTPERHDILQEVFLRILARLHTLREPSALRSWVVSIAVRCAREHLRQRRRRLRLVDSKSDVPAPADPEASALLRRAYSLLDRLHPDDRVAFLLRTVEGLTLQEIADTTGSSLATTKRRVRRGAEHFRKIARRDLLLSHHVPEDG